MEEEYGRIEIRLEELMKQKGFSKNRLAHKAGMSWKQIDNYCQSAVSRLDVLALCKFCTILGCGIGELVVFHPAEQEQKGK